MNTLAAIFVVAYRPFLDPLNLQRSWYVLLLPLCFGIAVAYKAVRVPDLRTYWKDVATFTAQLILSVILIGAAAFAIVEFVLPAILPND